MGLLNWKLRQENVVNINMFSVIAKYPFNVLKSNFLIMIVMRVCILIISFIQRVAIVPNVQTSSPSPRGTVLLTRRRWLSHLSQKPDCEEWLLSSGTVWETGRTGNSIYSPECDSGVQFLPWFCGNSESSREVEMVNKTLFQQMCKIDLKWT